MKKPRFDWKQAVDTPIPDNEDEAMLFEELDDSEYVYFVAGKTDIVEKHLNADERRQFDQAKDAALVPWIDNNAWEPVSKSEAQEGETCPMRFLLKWKTTPEGRKANARIIIQGFKHHDALTKKLDKEAPTLSRLGRNLLLM